MSTIVAVKKNGWACIAADTLTSFGDTREPAELIANYDKILKVGGSRLGVVGHAANIQVLESYFANLKEKPTLSSVSEIFETFRRMHRVLKEQYYVNPKEEEDDEYESSQISSLIVNAHGIFGVYTFREVEEYSKYFAFGSGYAFALGALAACYDRLDSAKKIAQVAIETAAKFDKGTGLPMTCYRVRLSEKKR